ncbi:MAG: molybdopterin-dependent oxidoreductase, partial [Acidimicrobiia bacterium]
MSATSPTHSRRQFLRQSFAASGAWLWRPETDVYWGRRRAEPHSPCDADPFAAGRLLGTLPLFGPGADDTPLEKMLGSGLDARFFTDVSTLGPGTLITPNEKFFIRTSYPDLLDSRAPWKIAVRGLVKRPVNLRLAELAPLAVPRGTYLIECCGNTNPRNFGLMSAARWSGIPISHVLSKLEILPRATHVQISGFDHHSPLPRRSVPGASWIFTFDQLERSGAFLATGMNEVPLPRDHGFPVRLIVPRWYGCASIKWVNEIVLLDEAAPSTDHMREFATRTHQDGIPSLARDFKPATVDQAAMAVRIEKWLVDGKIVYRVVGIMWGGSKPTDA